MQLKDLWSRAWSRLRDAVVAYADMARDVFSVSWDWIKSKVSNPLPGLKDKAKAVAPAVTETVKEKASELKEKAQERLVIISGSRWDISAKWALITILIAFGGGTYYGYRLDMSGFAKFKVKAAKLESENQKKIAALNADIAALRVKLYAEELDQIDKDKAFEEALNRKPERPVAKQCRVPVEDINRIIAESSQ